MVSYAFQMTKLSLWEMTVVFGIQDSMIQGNWRACCRCRFPRFLAQVTFTSTALEESAL
jgi:hypothetical protein